MAKQQDNKEISIPDLLKEVTPGFGIEGPLGGQYLHFNGDWIWANNGEVGCIVFRPDSIPELYGSVDGKRLAHFISRAPKPDKIQFRLREKEDAKSKKRSPWLQVRSGRASVDLKWLEDSPARMPDSPARWKSVPDGFAKAIGFVAHCCASHITRPRLTCVHVTNEYVESSDGMRIIRHDLEDTLKGVNTLIPRNVAFLLESTGVTKIAPKDDAVWFKTKKGTIIFCPLIAGDYPDIDPLIATSPDAKKFSLPFEVESKDGTIKLEDALDRARVFEGEEEELRIILEVKNGRMRIEAGDEVGMYQEAISLKDTPSDLSIRVEIYAQHLLDLVKQGQKVECELTSDKMWMRTDKWEFISVVEIPVAKSRDE